MTDGGYSDNRAARHKVISNQLDELPCFNSDHRKVTEAAANWILEKKIYVNEHGEPDLPESIRRAFISATFSFFTAPPDARTSGASLSDNDPLMGTFLGALMLVMIFMLDDLESPEEMRRFSQCIRLYRSDKTVTFESDRKNALGDYLRTLDKYDRDPSRFLAAFEEMSEHFAQDAEIPPGAMSEAVYARIRDITNGVPLYISGWEVICGVQLSQPERERLLDIRRIASELVYIVDDLASFRRDAGLESKYSQDLPDHNLIVIVAGERGISFQRAKKLAVIRYNSLVSDFNNQARLLKATGMSETVRVVNALARMINGNIVSRGFLQAARYTVEPELFLLRQVAEETFDFGANLSDSGTRYTGPHPG